MALSRACVCKPTGMSKSGGNRLKMRAGQTGTRLRINNKGFTLIEVLIATIILAAILYLAALSYSIFLERWGKENIANRAALDGYRKHILLRESLESIYDYYVTDPANEKKGTYYPFFRGTRESMEFVTLSSVFYGDVPAVARLKVERAGPGSKGLRRLIYEEAPLNQTYVKYVGAPIRFKRSMVVYDRLKICMFRYFGTSGTQGGPKRNRSETSYRWQDSYSGKARRMIPEKIELVLDNGSGKKALIFFIRTYNLYKKGFFRHEF